MSTAAATGGEVARDPSPSPARGVRVDVPQTENEQQRSEAECAQLRTELSELRAVIAARVERRIAMSDEQRCEHGRTADDQHERNGDTCFHPFACFDQCTGPFVVTPPEQDEQPEFYEIELDPVSGEVTTRAVPVAPSVSTDHTDEPKTAAELLREVREADPEGHAQRLARAYGAGEPATAYDVDTVLAILVALRSCPSGQQMDSAAVAMKLFVEGKVPGRG